MKKRLDDIAGRRLVLLEKIRIQKSEMAEISLHLQKPLALVDTGIKAIHFMRRHSVLISSGMAFIMVLRRKNLGAMVVQVLRMARIYLFSANFESTSAWEQRDTRIDS